MSRKSSIKRNVFLKLHDLCRFDFCDPFFKEIKKKFFLNGAESETIGIPITCLKIEFQMENNNYLIGSL